MLKSLFLRYGADPAQRPLSFPPGPMTVFVGPNNSGKSLALREIEDAVSGVGGIRRILERVEVSPPGPDVAERMLRERATAGGQTTPEGWLRVPRMRAPGDLPLRRATDAAEPTEYRMVDLGALREALGTAQPWGDDVRQVVCRDFLSFLTIRLDGQTRLGLTQPRLAGDLLAHPANHLDALFRDREARARIREITADALGMWFVIDPTGLTHFRIRMADRAPLDDTEEQGLDQRARAFHGRAHDIAELSDGVRAFTGLTAAVLSADYRVMLVDEPEAFLHPPLTRKLGKRLTQLAAERGANVLAATHSPDFLMGCIQSGKRVNIVRLTWRRGVSSARLLSADKLETLMRDPLLRSTGVLGALFHEGAAVCESDADRVFYSEINERLLAARAGGADGTVFLNAQNKQTIRRIIRPLREMGVPAAALVDLDLLKGREDFRDLLAAAFVPSVFWEPWEQLRARIHGKLRTDAFKKGGIPTLPRDLREPAEGLLDRLAEYGVFLVPTGELESWLPEMEVSGHGPEWLTQVFQRMGTDPLDDEYRPVGEGGVWRYGQRIAEWIANPHRAGMGEERIPLARRLAAPAEEPVLEDEAAPAEPVTAVAGVGEPDVVRVE